MAKPIAIGDTFSALGRTFTRLADDPAPLHACERIRLYCHPIPLAAIPEQRFGTEPEWFRQRGLSVEA
jgi:hypothetical protein